MLIGICQTNIVYENKTKNIEKAEKFISKAEKANADIVFFPEMSFTGFSMNTAVTGETDCFTVTKLRELASKHSIAVGFGWTALTEGKGENRYTIVNEHGKVINEYTKIHPFSYSNEDKYFRGGNKVSVFEYRGINISAFICYDLRFPEIFQSASKKAELIIVPANWPKARADHWKTLLKARAIENICYIAGINCTGNIGGVEYSGESCVYSPFGDEICAMGPEENISFVHIDNNVSDYRSSFPAKKDRRTELYKKLI